MVYSIDAAVEVLEVLNKSTDWTAPQIFAFQRDRRLHLVGREAVAVIDYGLSCSPRAERDDMTLKRRVRHDLANPEKSNVLGENGKIVGAEKKYFDALSLGDESGPITLAGILNLREVFDDFSDDGKIRMITHDSRYHSHKHGYGADGVDVWTNGARVMIRDEYFGAMKSEESNLRAKVKTDGINRNEGSPLPGVAIITPYALISFPFPVRLSTSDRELRGSWKPNSHLYANIVEFDKTASSFDESPHKFNLQLNGGVSFQPTSCDEFSQDYAKTLASLINLKDCYLPSVQEVIAQANELHNSVYSQQIATSKSRAKQA